MKSIHLFQTVLDNMIRKSVLENKLCNFITKTTKRILNEVKYTNGMLFVSYLKNEYNQKRFRPIEQDEMCLVTNKCRNGFWASPLDSDFGWKQWCEREDYPLGNNIFVFKLKDNAKIYVIDSYEDLKRISTLKDRYGTGYINYKELLSNGYDGIYVTDNAAKTLRSTEGKISGLSVWDVESICLFNPNVIIPVRREKVIELPKKNKNWWEDEEDSYFMK